MRPPVVRRHPASIMQANGRITVPASVRKLAGWKVGAKLVIALGDDATITLRPQGKAGSRKKNT